MSRLVVNPGTPQAWEIQLQPGSNSLGRSEANDFQINDPSVSGSHCEIVVADGNVALTDKGSTNGTFVGGSRVQEHLLEDGKGFRLGNVELQYHAKPIPAPTAPPTARIARRVTVPAVPTVAAVVAAAPPVAAAPVEAPPEWATGTRFCKYHPKSPGRFLCAKCDKTYCDMCIQLTDMGGVTARTCRGCGAEVVGFQFRKAPTKSFYAKLPGAFVYPFKGAGVIILLCATIAFGALGFVSGGLLELSLRFRSTVLSFCSCRILF